MTNLTCEVCNKKFSSKEEYDEHWKYVLNTIPKQYIEIVEEIEEELYTLMNKKGEKDDKRSGND